MPDDKLVSECREWLIRHMRRTPKDGTVYVDPADLAQFVRWKMEEAVDNKITKATLIADNKRMMAEFEAERKRISDQAIIAERRRCLEVIADGERWVGIDTLTKAHYARLLGLPEEV
jgi:hypothetical protein